MSGAFKASFFSFLHLVRKGLINPSISTGLYFSFGVFKNVTLKTLVKLIKLVFLVGARKCKSASVLKKRGPGKRRARLLHRAWRFEVAAALQSNLREIAGETGSRVLLRQITVEFSKYTLQQENPPRPKASPRSTRGWINSTEGKNKNTERGLFPVPSTRSRPSVAGGGRDPYLIDSGP